MKINLKPNRSIGKFRLFYSRRWMDYATRLIGTPLEADETSRRICNLLDWLNEEGISQVPSERGWAKILGYGSKNKDKARKALIRLEAQGIIFRERGHGRTRSKIEIPTNTNLPADKEERLNARRKEWIEHARRALSDKVKSGERKQEDVDSFIEYWADVDIFSFKMLWEKEKKFSLLGRFYRWKSKSAADSPTLFDENAEKKYQEQKKHTEEKETLRRQVLQAKKGVEEGREGAKRYFTSVMEEWRRRYGTENV